MCGGRRTKEDWGWWKNEKIVVIVANLEVAAELWVHRKAGGQWEEVLVHLLPADQPGQLVCRR